MSDMAATEGSVEQAGQQGAEASQTEGAQQQAAEAPLDPRVMEHLNKLGGQVGELGQMFESFAPALEQLAQGQQGQQGADPFADFGGEEFMSGLGEQTGMDPQQLQDTFRQVAQAEAQRMLAPVQEELRHQQFVKLEESYPDLKDPEKAAAVLDKSEQMASAFAQAMGLPPQMAAAIGLNADFVELVYKAEMADQRALAQSATGEQQEVQLEGGSAGAPAAQEPSLGERLAGAGPSGVSPDGNFRWW